MRPGVSGEYQTRRAIEHIIEQLSYPDTSEVDSTRSSWLALFLILLTGTTGCVLHSSDETRFTPAPNKRWVASVNDSRTGTPSLRYAFHGMNYWRASSALSIRDDAGRRFRRIDWAAGRHPDKTFVHDFSWSPDSQRLAVVWAKYRHLDIYDLQTKERRRIGEAGVCSFRWLNDGEIVYATSTPMKISVVKASVTTSESAVLLSLPSAGGDLDSFSLSPDCRRFVFRTAKELVIASPLDQSEAGRWPVVMFALRCSWHPSGDLCLISGALSTMADGTGAADSLENVLFLYDSWSNRLTDIGQQMRFLSADGRFSPFYDSGGWSTDRKWFLLQSSSSERGTGSDRYKDWLCTANPWTAVCLDDVLEQAYSPISFSPIGNVLALTKSVPSKPDEIWVTEVSSDASGRPVLSQPKFVAKPPQRKWAGIFWSADGATIVTFDSYRFTRHSVESRESRDE